MSTQPEALRLADLIRSRHGNDLNDEAAAELRRLHQFAEDQIGRATAAEAALQMTKVTHALKIAAVEAQRDALLEALQSTGLFLHHCWCDVQMNDYSFEKLNQQMAIVDAAIKAVEENT
jgi:intracellular sulfur oxidation DsrE/DsrF family protein